MVLATDDAKTLIKEQTEQNRGVCSFIACGWSAFNLLVLQGSAGRGRPLLLAKVRMPLGRIGIFIIKAHLSVTWLKLWD